MTDARFALVKSVAKEPSHTRIAIGHDHFRERSTIEDRANLALVFVPDGIEHQAFARVQRVTKPPFLPTNFVPTNLETRALRLNDLERLRSFAQRSDRFLVKVGLGFWNGYDAIIDKFQYSFFV